MGRLERTVELERSALQAHREMLRGSQPPPRPEAAPRGSFVHGFLLLFSLFVATLRNRELRGPYVRVTAMRLAVIAFLSVLALETGSPPRRARTSPTLVVKHDVEKPASSHGGFHLHGPGVDIDIGPPGVGSSEGAASTALVPRQEARTQNDEAVATQPATHRPAWLARLGDGWERVLAALATVALISSCVVALSRRYDDWLSFHASRLAAVLPEDASPKVPRIALDMKWLWKKLRRRIRGYVVFGAGVPVLAILALVPGVGPTLLQVALVAWGWFWLGVFTAAKSAHAWADEDSAPPPRILRAVSERVPRVRVAAPVHAYARLWAWLTRGVNAPAAVFERTPAAFLGLALARAVLALPGLYVLARPLVPVAAGRLCAEADPQGRFSVSPDSVGPDAGQRASIGLT